MCCQAVRVKEISADAKSMFIIRAKALSPDNNNASVLEKIASQDEHMCDFMSSGMPIMSWKAFPLSLLLLFL